MRLNLNISDEQGRAMKEIMKKCSISTITGCVVEALSLLQWVVSQLLEGRKIISVKEGERDRELALPWLNATK